MKATLIGGGGHLSSTEVAESLQEIRWPAPDDKQELYVKQSWIAKESLGGKPEVIESFFVSTLMSHEDASAEIQKLLRAEGHKPQR